MLVPVLLDTVVARPVRSCPRQHQLPVQVVRLVHMDLLLETMTPDAVIALPRHGPIKQKVQQLVLAEFAPTVRPPLSQDFHQRPNAAIVHLVAISKMGPLQVV